MANPTWPGASANPTPNDADLAAHLSGLSVEDYAPRTSVAPGTSSYATMATHRPAPFSPYDPYLYYSTGMDPSFTPATPHQFSYELASLGSPMQSMASVAAAAGMGAFDYPLSPETYDRTNQQVAPLSPGPYHQQLPGRGNPPPYRPQMGQGQQPSYYAHGDRSYWQTQQRDGTRHSRMNSSIGSSGRGRGSQPPTPHFSLVEFGGAYTPLTPAYTGGQYGMYGTPYSPSSYSYGRTGRRHTPSDEGSMRSALLESFRQRKSPRLEISDIFGSICEFACDQHGSRFIQNKLENATHEQRDKVFEEILPNAYQLMTDVFGNYVVQKLFEHGDTAQKAALADKMEGKVFQLSMQMYGCRVMQKALEHLLLEQREKLVAELTGHVIECVKSSNANHVIQRLMTLDPPKVVCESFIGHVQELSSHPFGCRVLQKTFEVLEPKKIRPLLDEMHTCSAALMKDQFGNYVVQSVLTAVPGREYDRDKVISKMKNHIVDLSRHKFSSNVVEKAIKTARASDRRAIINEMIGDAPDSRIGDLLRDAYGNFAVQTALAEADADQRDTLLAIIIPMMPNLRLTPCGRRLEQKISELESMGLVPQLSHSLTVTSVNSPDLCTVASDTEDSLNTASTGTSPDRARDRKGPRRVSSPLVDQPAVIHVR